MNNQRVKSNLITLLIIIFMIALAIQLYQPVQSAPITFIVTNSNPSGAGSLYQAILDANINPGQDLIAFNIPTSDSNYNSATGVFTILLLGPLPELTDPDGTIIDGTTQTTYVGNTNPSGPEIEVKKAMPFTETLLILEKDNNTIKGLSFIGDMISIAIDIYNFSHNNVITENYIGISATGDTCGGHIHGIRIGSQNNTISNNVISCNLYDAVQIHSTSSLNQITRNIIGLNAQKNKVIYIYASYAYGNQENGISIFSSNTNTISDNYISHNGKSGIVMQASQWNTIQRNVIGANDTASTQLGNKEHGILLQDYSIDNLISENYVAGNGKSGIYLTGFDTWGNQLRKNQIGVNKNSHLIPNGHHGIGIYNGAHANTVGDLSVTEYGNKIYNNSWSGIAIVNSADSNIVASNQIGNPPGVGMNYHGIAIVNSSDNLITLNTIAGNGITAEAAGVLVDGITAPAIRNRITQNSIYNNHTMGIKLINNGNEGIVPPVINSVDFGLVQGIAFPGSTVEVFSDGGSQGRYYEGFAIADPVGVWEWLGTPRGPYVTATQTDANHNTSGFSSPYSFSRNCIYLPLITR